MLREFLNVVRVAVANADDGMTAIKVEVRLTLIVPYVATFAAYYIDVEKGIDRK